MKPYFLIIISLVSLNIFSQARLDDIFKFTMSCKIGDISVVQMQDGISGSYRGFNGGYKTGDIITFKLRANARYINNKLDGYNFSLYSTDKEMPFNLTLREDRIIDKLGAYNYSHGSYISIDSQLLALKSDYGYGQIFMQRYYKNDWQIIYNKMQSNGSYVASANCMNVNDGFDEFFGVLKEVHGDID